MRSPLLFVLPFSFVAAACSSASSETPDDTSTSSASTTAATTGSGGAGGDAATSTSASAGGASGEGGHGPIGGDRPVKLHVPPSYSDDTPMPLVILLHGYSASGPVQNVYFGLTKQSDEKGFLYAYPDGTKDSAGNHFWNATDACCNFDGSDVDDSAYLQGVVDDIKGQYNVDPKRVYFVGHSNGGFMSYRMACDHADTIAAIVSLAGAMFDDTSKCTPSEPVSVLQIHGTADETIGYAGGVIGVTAYPGAATTVLDWVDLDGCSTTPDFSAPLLDLEGAIPGTETGVTRYAEGCQPGGSAELWTITGGSHVPTLSASFAPAIIDFLLAHPKP